MKKLIVIVFSAFMLVLLTVSSFAEHADCRSVSKEERDAVGAGGSDMVFRIYNGTFLHGFAAGDSIDHLTGTEYVLEEILVSYRQNDYNSAACYRMKDNAANKVDGLDRASAVFAEYTSESAVQKLEKKTKSAIRSIVCLCGEPSHDGIYVYYETERGDFVLYKDYASDDKVYFFPASDFYAVAKEYYEAKQASLYDENGEVRKDASVRMKDAVNIKKYELSLNNADRSRIIVGAAIGSAIVLSSLVIAFIIIKRVRAKRTAQG